MVDERDDFWDEFNDAIRAELDGVWQDIKNRSIELCPKESGALASSIELESEGGSGTVGASDTLYTNAIYAGNDQTFNFEGQPTSQYASAVHDGHMLANGDFWEGCPFLTDALDQYEGALLDAVARGLDQVFGD